MFGLSPLGDQEFAGALMWVCITFAYLIPAAAITTKVLSPRRSFRDRPNPSVEPDSFISRG
jgi:hypothetical protein